MIQSTKGNTNDHRVLSDLERMNIQQEIKNYLVRYFKKIQVEEVNSIKVDLYKDMMLVRLEGFLTEQEKSDAKTPSGIEAIRISRGEAARQNIIDNIGILEMKLGARVFYQTYDLDPEKDFATFLIVFNRIITD